MDISDALLNFTVKDANNSTMPVAIINHEGGLFHYAAASEIYKKELQTAGLDSLSDAERFLNNKKSFVYDSFLKSVLLSLEKGAVQIKDFVVNSEYFTCKIKSRRDVTNPEKIICNAYLMNLADNTPSTLEMDKVTRGLCSLYDHINLVDTIPFTIKRIFTKTSKYLISEEEIDAVGYIDKYAESFIYPDEQERYKKYFSLAEVFKNFENEKSNFIVNYFRTKNDQDEYIWKAYVLIRANYGDGRYIYSCVRDVDLTTEHVLIKENYVELFNDLPMAYSIMEVKLDGDKVSDVICLFASKKVSEIMGVPNENMVGKSMLNTVSNVDEWADLMYDAAYNGKTIKETQFISNGSKWVSVVMNQAAQRGRCAVILEDVTHERLNTMRLGREWRTDDLIITTAKYLHCGLPYEEAINRVIKVIGEAIHSRRIYILESNGDNTYTETFEWCNRPDDSVKDLFKKMTRDTMINWEEEYPGAMSLIVDDVSSLEFTHPNMYEILSDLGIKSIIEIPIMDEGQNIGYFGVLDYTFVEAFDVKQLLETVSYFISAEIVRKKLLRELENKSVFDTLCGVRNRNAMEIRIKRLKKKNAPIGVLYADANCLKKLNDTKGHEAGDALLKTISGIMADCFSKDTVYRAGGDEFLAIMYDISDVEFIAKCEELSSMIKAREDISVALGWAWHYSSSDIEEVMKMADSRMYADKANYYKKNNRRKS